MTLGVQFVTTERRLNLTEKNLHDRSSRRQAIETHLIKQAGLTRQSGAKGGMVTLVQRFGSALNLNIHLHMLILDGVYTEDEGNIRFHPVPPPPQHLLESLLATTHQVEVEGKPDCARYAEYLSYWYPK
jgi:hypothetical protein